MIDYKKADQACKMLEESGTTYMLAYNNDSQNVVNCAFGRYPLLKSFIVHVVAELADILCRNYGEEKMIAELQGMTFQAVELFYNKKKEMENFPDWMLEQMQMSIESNFDYMERKLEETGEISLDDDCRFQQYLLDAIKEQRAKLREKGQHEQTYVKESK